MKIKLRTHRQELTASRRRSLIRGVRGTLGRFAHQIVSVLVHSTDTNGPRGGVDTLCTVVVHTRQAGQIVIRQRGESLAPTLGAGLARARHSLARAVGEPRRQRWGSRFDRADAFADFAR